MSPKRQFGIKHYQAAHHHDFQTNLVQSVAQNKRHDFGGRLALETRAGWASATAMAILY
jgi:hypothetical protein